MTRKSIVINNENIAPGDSVTLKLPVGRIPSGTRINIHAHVFRSPNPGPTMLVMGGVHGDEINGVETVRRAIANNYFDNLLSGTIIAIPLLNIHGFINFSRDTPDGKDVNRSFPGSMNGSLSSRVARTLTKKILPHIDLAIDYHTGGASRYNYPQVRYSLGHKESKALAETFAAPYIIANKPIPKSFRKAALDKGVPVLTFEGGESIRYDGFSIKKGLDGLLRVMKLKGMVEEAPEAKECIHFTKTSWVRANHSGLFMWTQSSGAKVSLDEPLGVINNPNGRDSYKVYAKHDGYLIGHNNASVVGLGDALFHIGHTD